MTRTREQPGGDFLDFVLACINAIGDISKQEAGDAIEREWKLRGDTERRAFRAGFSTVLKTGLDRPGQMREWEFRRNPLAADLEPEAWAVWVEQGKPNPDAPDAPQPLDARAHMGDGAGALREVGYVACWDDREPGKHCRKPKGHDGACAYF